MSAPSCEWEGSEITIEPLEAIIRNAQSRLRLPGISAAVAVDSDVAWRDARGFADVDHGVRSAADTPYCIGSVTKTFTAAAVMRLRDDGALDLDQRVCHYLKEFPHPKVTIRQLLSHTAGVQREPASEGWATFAFPTSEELRATMRSIVQVCRPGRWHYSNLGYALLGEIIEVVSGDRWDNVIASRLTAPLALDSTTCAAVPGTATGYLVHPYHDTVKPLPLVDLGALAPAGQLSSTAPDLARWAAFLASDGRGLLSPASIGEMHAVHAMVDGTWMKAWGLGVWLRRREERILAGHNGFMPGFRVVAVWSPGESVGAAVMVNSQTPGVDDVALDLLDAFVGSRDARPAAWIVTGSVPVELSGVLGIWWKEGVGYVLSYRDGKLVSRLDGELVNEEESVFEPVGPDHFIATSGPDIGETLTISREPDGKPVALRWATYPCSREPFA
jgi:CubicO group peptidase (beta-lactamase class C family)